MLIKLQHEHALPCELLRHAVVRLQCNTTQTTYY